MDCLSRGFELQYQARSTHFEISGSATGLNVSFPECAVSRLPLNESFPDVTKEDPAGGLTDPSSPSPEGLELFAAASLERKLFAGPECNEDY